MASSSNLDKSQLPQHLKCPICLDKYNGKPRMLKCQDTFCEKCIHSHITSSSNCAAKESTTIVCPCCRGHTESPCPNKPRTQWASELPVHFVIQYLLDDNVTSDGAPGEGISLLETDMEKFQTTLADTVDKLKAIAAIEVENQIDDIPRQMSVARDTIVNTLDQLVAKVTDDCEQLKKQRSKELEDAMATVKGMERAVKESLSLLQTLAKAGELNQKCIAIHREQAREYWVQLEKVQDNMMVSHYELTFSDELTKINENLDCLTANVAERLRLQMKMTDIVKRGQLQQPGFIGSVYLPDGPHVVTDYLNRLCCLMDESFKVTADVILPAIPWGVTVMKQDHICVTMPYVKQIQIIKVQGNTLTLTRTIRCSRQPWRIARASDTELVVTWDKGLGIIDVDGNERSYFDEDKTGREIPFHRENCIECDATKKRLFHSCCLDHTVYCMSYTGDVHFSYNTDLEQPCGMAIDGESNLLVCSLKTKTVHQVSPAGKLIRKIHPGISRPYTVCFSPTGDTMTVMNMEKDTNKGSKVKLINTN